MITLHSLPHDLLRHVFGKLHLPALARLAITNQAWSATITSIAQDGNLEAITRWRAVIAALSAGAGGTTAAREEQELQAQRRLDLLEHVPHLITDGGGVKAPKDQGSVHRQRWDYDWNTLVTPDMYRTHGTTGERICSAVFHLHGQLRWELSRQIHELLCALCLRASPADAIRLVQDIPTSLGAAWCDESEHSTSICNYGTFLSHAAEKSWQPPSASVFSMLRRVEWTPALALTLHTTVFVPRQGNVQLHDFSVIANATHLLRRLNFAASPDVWFAETSSLIEDGASEGEAVALLLARSRVGKVLQFEDEVDDDALDWDLDSMQERRAECAAELAAQVATLPVRSMAVVGSRGSLEPPASSLAVCPRAQWPTRLTTKRVRVRAGALARHLAEEDFDLLDEHQQNHDGQYPGEGPWRYEHNWFPSATAFLHDWAEAATFPLQCDDACRRALVQELTWRPRGHEVPQGHARYRHGLFDAAVRSIILGWVSKVARAGQDVESLLPGNKAAS